MTPTTYASFVAAVAGLTITGVTRKYAYPPQSIGTADLPASFPLIPAGGDQPIIFNQGGNLGHVMRMDFVIAYEPTAQSTSESNFSGCITMMDNATTALRAMTRPTQGAFSWTMRQGAVTIGNVEYWAVIVSLEGNG
jgi:hypothetical protein